MKKKKYIEAWRNYEREQREITEVSKGEERTNMKEVREKQKAKCKYKKNGGEREKIKKKIHTQKLTYLLQAPKQLLGRLRYNIYARKSKGICMSV